MPSHPASPNNAIVFVDFVFMWRLGHPRSSSTAVETNNAPKTGWIADMKKMWREGKFKTYARWGGVLNVIVCIALCLLLLGYSRRPRRPARTS